MIGTGFQIVFVMVSTIGSTYLTNTRTYWMFFNTIMALIGSVMIRQIDPAHIWARFMGYCLIIAFSANFPLTMTMISNNTAGFTKKSTVTAVVRSFPCIVLATCNDPVLISNRTIGVCCILCRKHRWPTNHVRQRST